MGCRAVCNTVTVCKICRDKPNMQIVRSSPRSTRRANGKKLLVGDQHTTSTALRLAVGHDFTSDYTARFRPDRAPEYLACPCGWPVPSFHHILYVRMPSVPVGPCCGPGPRTLARSPPLRVWLTGPPWLSPPFLRRLQVTVRNCPSLGDSG